MVAPTPAFLDLFSTDEQRGVSVDRIEEQALIGVRNSVNVAIFPKIKIERVCLQGQLVFQTLAFRHHRHLNAFIGLQTNDEAVGLGGLALTKNVVGQGLILDDNFGDFVGHTLTSPEIKGNSGPSPVIHIGLDGYKGLGIAGARCATLFLEIPRYGLTIDNTLAVLATHNVLFHRRRVYGPQRFDDFDLLIADTFGFQRIWRFHGNQTEQLHQMVLHHVPQLTDTIVVGPTPFDTDFFGNRDLHVIDTALIPL